MNNWEDVANQIKNGAVGVLPTDTLYGVVCSAADETAVRRLYQLKSRDAKPGTLAAASIDQLVSLGIPRRYLVAAERYWLTSTSVVIPVGSKLGYLHQGVGSVAIRIPGDETFRRFLEQTGPLLTSSANLPGENPATTVLEAREYFGDKIDFYVDGGDLSGKAPSTIIRVVDDTVEVLREGAVKINEYGEIEP